jgi:succinate dehydrogenase/fumarate reductase flavoprotein subunit
VLEKAEQSSTVEARARLYGQFMSREVGPDWKESNIALQQIMKDYAGVMVRSDTLLNAGLRYFGRMKEQVLDTMVARNSHTLMRCLEVLDLMECAEAIFLTALERKETRAQHKRSDFPFTNPLLADKFLTIRREKGIPVLEWRDRA